MAAVLVDGGGSTTRIGICTSDGVVWKHLGSLHHEAAEQASTWARLLDVVGNTAARSSSLLVFAGLSVVVDQESADRISDTLEHSIRRATRSATVVTSNDIAPLLFASPKRTVVAMIAGTGTGFAARTPNGIVRRASGAEYLLSDEGGGFDLGLQGLRAVMKASDGRGPATALSTAALALGGGSLKGLREYVYAARGEAGGAKERIAAFAHAVLCAAGTDAVASALVTAAARELVAGVVAVRPATEPAGALLVLSGSLLGTKDGALLRERTLAGIAASGTTFGEVEVVVDSREHTVRCAGELVAGRLTPDDMLDPTGSLPLAVRVIGDGALGGDPS